MAILLLLTLVPLATMSQNGYGASKHPRRLKVGSHTRSMPADGINEIDGEPPKRRGPKPDSKPAATKRQEMNRLAQRYYSHVVVSQCSLLG